jgi:hypothetical protein
MSIVNAYVCTDHALVVTDSLVYFPSTGRSAPASKLSVLTHLNAVVAQRGYSLFLPTLALHSNQPRYGDSFDAVIQNFHEIVESAFTDFLSVMEAVNLPDGNRVSEELLYMHRGLMVGWSAERGCAFGRVFERGGKLEPFRFQDIDGRNMDYFLSPGAHEQLAGLSPVVDQESMEAAARAQAQLLYSINPQCGVGGHLRMVRIERDRMTITKGPELAANAPGWGGVGVFSGGAKPIWDESKPPASGMVGRGAGRSGMTIEDIVADALAEAEAGFNER